LQIDAESEESRQRCPAEDIFLLNPKKMFWPYTELPFTKPLLRIGREDEN
jgi:hypothetical protein